MIFFPIYLFLFVTFRVFFSFDLYIFKKYISRIINLIKLYLKIFNIYFPKTGYLIKRVIFHMPFQTGMQSKPSRIGMDFGLRG